MEGGQDAQQLTAFPISTTHEGLSLRSSHKLCNKCQRVVQDVISEIGFDEMGSISRHLHQRTHYANIRELVDSATNGCQLCLLLRAHPQIDRMLEDGKDLQQSKYEIYPATRKMPEIALSSYSEGEECLYVRVVFKEVLDLSYADRRPSYAKSTGSEETLKIVRYWLDKCVAEHDACRQSRAEKWLPTRLIDVGTSSNDSTLCLCLREDITADSIYVTLSHCWGSSSAHTLQLTQGSIESLKKEIRLSDLPKTFLDAVLVARFLGIRYLWIDSLCILQDSVEDWRSECSVMGLVYKNSHCNIAAVAASNNTEGCFYERPPTLLEPFIVERAYSDCLASTESSRPSDRQIWSLQQVSHLSDYRTLPLYRRGWVIQEWFQAPRIIHFGQPFTHWECLTTTSSEVTPEVAQYRTLHGTRSPRNPVYDQKTCWKDWSAILSLYTTTQLSKSSDKLPAISGIANEFQRRFNQETPVPQFKYVAGLWTKYMAQQLLWRTEEPHTCDVCPQKYRAPSWSWASLDKKIHFPTPSEEREKNLVLQLIQYHVQPVGNDPFQEVSGGSVQLQAWLWKVRKGTSKIRWCSQAILELGPLRLRFDDGSAYTNGPAISLSFDICLLPVLFTGHVPRKRFEGLIIRETGGSSGQFTRVGYFELRPDHPCFQTSSDMKQLRRASRFDSRSAAESIAEFSGKSGTFLDTPDEGDFEKCKADGRRLTLYTITMI